MREPVRLGKQQRNDSFYNSKIIDMMEAWVISHATIFVIITICLLMALFVCLIFALTGVSATDSGVQYNHFENIVL